MAKGVVVITSKKHDLKFVCVYEGPTADVKRNFETTFYIKGTGGDPYRIFERYVDETEFDTVKLYHPDYWNLSTENSEAMAYIADLIREGYSDPAIIINSDRGAVSVQATAKPKSGRSARPRQKAPVCTCQPKSRRKK